MCIAASAVRVRCVQEDRKRDTDTTGDDFGRVERLCLASSRGQRVGMPEQATDSTIDWAAAPVQPAASATRNEPTRPSYLDSPQGELALLRALIAHRLVGPHKHVQMVALLTRLQKDPHAKALSTTDVWAKWNELYEAGTLDTVWHEQASLPFSFLSNRNGWELTRGPGRCVCSKNNCCPGRLHRHQLPTRLRPAPSLPKRPTEQASTTPSLPTSVNARPTLPPVRPVNRAHPESTRTTSPSAISPSGLLVEVACLLRLQSLPPREKKKGSKRTTLRTIKRTRATTRRRGCRWNSWRFRGEWCRQVSGPNLLPTVR